MEGYLVLSRGLNEKVMIGNDIEVLVAEFRHGKVRLAIKAPKNVEVHREEVYHAIQKERAEQAANIPPAADAAL